MQARPVRRRWSGSGRTGSSTRGLGSTRPSSPARAERPALFVSGRALDADHGPILELDDVRGSCVGACAPHPGHDLVDDVLDPWSLGIDVHPRRADALLEELLAGPDRTRSPAGSGSSLPGRRPCRSSPCRASRRCPGARPRRSRRSPRAMTRTSRWRLRPPAPARRHEGGGRHHRPRSVGPAAGLRRSTPARRRTAGGPPRSSSAWCTSPRAQPRPSRCPRRPPPGAGCPRPSRRSRPRWSPAGRRPSAPSDRPQP